MSPTARNIRTVVPNKPPVAGGFPRNTSALEDMSGDPLFGHKGDIHDGLEVIETERGVAAPDT